VSGTRTRSIDDRPAESLRLSDIRALVDQCGEWAESGVDVSVAFELKSTKVHIEASRWPTEAVELVEVSEPEPEPEPEP